MATFKQYLQNRWYRWMSKDRAVAYPYQFQYGRNVNVRNEKGWVMLSADVRLTSCATDHIVQIEPIELDLCYALTYDQNDNSCDLNHINFTSIWYTLTSLTTLQNWRLAENNDVAYWPRIKKFRDWVFVVNWQSMMAYYVNDESGWPYAWVNMWQLIADLWPLDNITYWFKPHIRCVYNFADTFFLIAVWGVLLRYQPLTNTMGDLANWKIIRYFWVGNDIVWLSQSWNYLRIYVTDWFNTECHYAQWTFDLEESWMVQTVRYEWVLIPDWLATDWVKDYWLFKTNIWVKLLEMDWYSYETIRETEKRYVLSWDTHEKEYVFGTWDTWEWAKLCWYNNTLYCSIPEEWIWTFTKESVWSHWWVWWGVIEWWKECFDSEEYYTWGMVWHITILNWIMITLILNPFWTLASQDYWLLWTTEVSNYPEKYVKRWYIIGNVYDWGCGSLFKKNVSTTLVCWNMTPWLVDRWIISLWYRYDRQWNSFQDYLTWTSNIKVIEVPDIYDSIYITSVQRAIWGIPAGEVGTEPPLYNKPRNTIEYVILFQVPQRVEGAETIYNKMVSPILYEHNLIYEDSMRKYR